MVVKEKLNKFVIKVEKVKSLSNLYSIAKEIEIYVKENREKGLILISDSGFEKLSRKSLSHGIYIIGGVPDDNNIEKLRKKIKENLKNILEIL